MAKKKIVVKHNPKPIKPLVEEVILKEEPVKHGTRCECGDLALPNNHQCWACSHRN